MRPYAIVLRLLLSLGVCRGSAYAQTSETSEQRTASETVKVATAPEHAATEAQVREYLALTGIVRVMREVLSKTFAAQRASAAPYYPGAYWDDMQSEFLETDFEAKLIPIYQSFISAEDMAEIIRFYRSPPGKRILATQMPITQTSQVIFRKLGHDIGVQVYEKHKEEIETAKKKYEAQAPAK